MPNKPEPMFINGRYHFTLSSYEPVEVTLTIPHLTETEVGYGMAGVLAERGWNRAEPPSDAWIAEHVDGISSLGELSQAVHEELEQINQQYLEASKPGVCAEKLAERLEQSVPESLVQEARDTVYQGLAMQAQQAGLSPEQAIASMGMTPGEFEDMVEEQAQSLAAQDAALEAIVEEYAIYADETEIPELLGLSPKDAQYVIEDARKHNDFDEMMAFARRRKAATAVARDANVSYENETAEQAAKRVEQMRAQMGTQVPDDKDDEKGSGGDKGGHPHLELV